MFFKRTPKEPAQKPEERQQKPEERQGFFKRLRARLNRGNSWLTYDLAELFRGRKIDAQALEELETRLLSADVGVEATEHILAGLQKRVARNELADVAALITALRTASKPRSTTARSMDLTSLRTPESARWTSWRMRAVRAGSDSMSWTT